MLADIRFSVSMLAIKGEGIIRCFFIIVGPTVKKPIKSKCAVALGANVLDELAQVLTLNI